MRKYIIIGLLSILLASTSQAQKIYSQENLEQASQQELNNYLDKALKLKKDGKTVTIVGASALGVAVIWGIADPLDHEIGTVLEAGITGIAGIASMIVGISMNVTGKNRVERINTIKNTAYNGIFIEIKPCTQYNLMTQNYQPGVTLGIMF